MRALGPTSPSTINLATYSYIAKLFIAGLPPMSTILTMFTKFWCTFWCTVFLADFVSPALIELWLALFCRASSVLEPVVKPLPLIWFLVFILKLNSFVPSLFEPPGPETVPVVFANSHHPSEPRGKFGISSRVAPSDPQGRIQGSRGLERGRLLFWDFHSLDVSPEPQPIGARVNRLVIQPHIRIFWRDSRGTGTV